MLERMEYIVARIDGDYAYLMRTDHTEGEEKCVARALLPAETGEGSHLVYEMMEYSLQ